MLSPKGVGMPESVAKRQKLDNSNPQAGEATTTATSSAHLAGTLAQPAEVLGASHRSSGLGPSRFSQ